MKTTAPAVRLGEVPFTQTGKGGGYRFCYDENPRCEGDQEVTIPELNLYDAAKGNTLFPFSLLERLVPEANIDHINKFLNF